MTTKGTFLNLQGQEKLVAAGGIKLEISGPKSITFALAQASRKIAVIFNYTNGDIILEFADTEVAEAFHEAVSLGLPSAIKKAKCEALAARN